MVSAPDYFFYLESLFERNRTSKAPEMKRYMRNQFEFYGITSPIRKELTREMIGDIGIPAVDELEEVVRRCWNSDYREPAYVVRDLVSKSIKKLDRSWFDIFEELITTKSWWDTVDFVAPDLAAKLFLRFPDEIIPRTNRWIHSDNIWLQRSAIIFQLSYKANTNPDLLFSHILIRADSREFFVQKAAGWALRQYARTNPEAVRLFIMNQSLPALTKREGMKHL